MATAISGGSRIRTNTSAENAYNALKTANDNIAVRQLRVSTGKRINSVSDDIAGYITSKSLQARNSSLKSALKSVGEAKNVTAIVQDSLENIQGLLNDIKGLASNAASGALGTDEKVALAKGAFRLSEQIQTLVDSTVFGGRELLSGSFSGDWNVGFTAKNNLINISINLKSDNGGDYNIATSTSVDFNLNATSGSDAGNAKAQAFAAVTGLDLEKLDEIDENDLGIFAQDKLSKTLTSLSSAITNVNKVASYVGGIDTRLTSQATLLTSQITNYNAAVSRIEDAEVAEEQLELIKAQFLQTASITSLTQANQNPQNFLQLFR
jgi:flagellin